MDKKDVYLCYNAADRPWVEELASQLESETIDGSPSSRPLSVFFDQWDMDIGDSLISKMNEGLKNADFVVTVLSPEFLAAPWPEFEWKHVVAGDPTNSSGRLIPILLRKNSLDDSKRIELVAPFRDLKWLDFSDPAHFLRSFAELVRRIRREPNPRGARRAPLAPGIASMDPEPRLGSSWHPDVSCEYLSSNLLAVASLPEKLYGAPTKHRKKKEVWDAVKGSSPFILRGGMLFSFADLNSADEPLFHAVEAARTLPVNVADWIEDSEKSRWLIELLNGCLASHLRREGLRNLEGERFYYPPGDSDLRKKRTLSGCHRSVAKEIGLGDSKFWFHLGCRIKFIMLGVNPVIWVDPCFLFTIDGSSPVSGKAMGKLSQLWGGKQQNDDILRDLLFWFDVIRGDDPDKGIRTGSNPVHLASVPISAASEFGIEGDRIKFKALRKSDGADLKTIAETICDQS